MWSRFSLPVVAVVTLSTALVVPLPAQQVPNPILPGPSGTGGGLTRDALDAPAETPRDSASAPSRRTVARSASRHANSSGTSRKSGTYATINRHRRHHRSRRDATMVATNAPAKRQPTRRRAPLVSFIYWWNGWVVRTFHTRSGTVLLDKIGAKS